MTVLAIAGLAFLLIHVLPATPLRARLTGAMGEGGYLGLFSLLSLALFFWWAHAFTETPDDARAWGYADWWPWVKAALLLFASVLFVGAVSSPSPAIPRGAKLLERPDVGSGIYAITRHPMMWAFALWGIAHFISEPNWRGFWFFGIFAITALIGSVLQDQRKAATFGASWQPFARRTSFWPFLAMLEGRARLSLAEIGWWRIAAGVLLWAALLYLHPWLFRVSPLPGLG